MTRTLKEEKDHSCIAISVFLILAYAILMLCNNALGGLFKVMLQGFSWSFAGNIFIIQKRLNQNNLNNDIDSVIFSRVIITAAPNIL